MPLSITSGWASVLLVAICLFASIIGTWAVFSWRIDSIDARLKATEALVTAQNQAIIVNSESMEWIKGSLIRIEGKLDCAVTNETCLERSGRIIDVVDRL